MSGCAAPDPGKVKPIQTVYADQIGRLAIGMDVKEFKRILPEAYQVAQNTGATAYEVSLKQVIYDRRRPGDTLFGLYQPQNIVNDQVLWFYFMNDRLTKWGKPNDWAIIEPATK